MHLEVVYAYTAEGSSMYMQLPWLMGLHPQRTSEQQAQGQPVLWSR